MNNAIQQLNRVAQQNAGSAEEISSIDEELTSQAEQLQTTIAFFKVSENGDGSASDSLQEGERVIAAQSIKKFSRPGVVTAGKVQPDDGDGSDGDRPTGHRYTMDDPDATGDAEDAEFERY